LKFGVLIALNMARTTRDKALKVNLTMPTSVRKALAAHVKSKQKNDPGITESAFIANLLRRSLNLSGTGMPLEEREHIETFWNEIQRYSPQKDDLADGKMALDALAAGARFSSSNQELWRAVPWFILSATENSVRLRRAVVDSNRILIPRVNYTSFGNAIADLIHEWITDPFFGETKFEFSDPVDGAFDAAINLEYPLTEKVLYLFPFFLTEFRRLWAGVVPYGQHVAIGWVVHKDATFFKENELKELQKIGTYFDDERAESLRHKFLSKLFSHLTSKSGAQLHVEDNYLHREIFPLLKSNFQHGVAVEKFSTREFCKIQPKINQTVVSGLKPDEVVLYDLGLSNAIEEAAKATGHTVIRFAHGQYIPVGIGFSLPALPFMGRKILHANKETSVADAFKEEVLHIVQQSENSFAKELWGDGILLNEELRYEKGTKLNLNNIQFARKYSDALAAPAAS
jgi:hypothetical protein